MERPLYLSVLTLRTLPGKRQELIDLYAELEILRKALAQPGAIDMALTEALDDADSILITSSWDDPASYQAWLDNPARDELTAAIGPFLAGDPHATTYRVVEAISG
jgi:quinol monooxygenase YgiN